MKAAGGGKRNIDFTSGSIVLKIVLFSLPIIAGELLQTLYNSVDSIIVGRVVGDAALAAISTCTPLCNLVVNFFNGMSLGNTVLVARSFGSGDEEGTKLAICHAFTFSVVLGVIVSLLGILFSPVLLRLAGANEEIYQYALDYLRIYLAGLMFTVIYNSGTGIIRAVGDSRSPLIILAGTSVLNVLLDILFTAVFRWGISGAAFATVISQACSVLLIYRVIRKRSGRKVLDLRETWLHGRTNILNSMRVGVSAGVQYALVNFSNVFVWRYINQFPTNQIAAMGITVRLDRFVTLPIKTFSTTLTTYISQNLGARNQDRARQGIVHCALLALGVTFVLSTGLLLLRTSVCGLFSKNPAVVELAKPILLMYGPFFYGMMVRELLLGILRGYGDSTRPMLVSLVGMVGLRQIYLAIVTRVSSEFKYVALSFPMFWGVTAFLLFIYFLCVRKRLFREA